MKKFFVAQQVIQARNAAIQNVSQQKSQPVGLEEIGKHVVHEDSLNVMMFLDLDYIRGRIASLHSSFSSNPNANMLHTFAAKACQLKPVLKLMATNGMGVECASEGELLQALRSEVPPENIVFDSPAKTTREILLALKHGVALNIDNFQEFDRVQRFIQTQDPSAPYKSLIGLRINPQVGSGTMPGFNTATPTGKFGFGLGENRNQLKKMILCTPWIRMLHCHVGSQGCDLDLITGGLRRIVDFANEINSEANEKRISTIDIGGGVSVNFASDEVFPTYDLYVNTIAQKVPELFDGSFRVITEFGRATIAKAGFSLCQVEYTKQTGGRHIAVVQTGTDLLIRTIYHPDKWPLRVTVLDSNGVRKPFEDTRVYDISGPCCLQMDIVAHQRELPEIVPGDYILLHDTGAYYHASYSYYNSRTAPGVFGFTASEDKVEIQTLCAPKTVEQTLEFYS